MMMLTECLAWMDSMGWVGWLMPLAVLLLIGLAATALARLMFFKGNAVKGNAIKGDRP
ncbi:hypothetical protein HCU01_39050 [Halomonas cupida]|uniref:Uncharacterized protein n=1 Tax=Halomonas cupida TaxID=44933 RepID=A0A1M7MUL8_9GAMM|nr:hypothetical protein [Halomonas cupida]GEN25956.1 hypothetical protein HCU01_39050 [Halomonas cupida]SHM94714.1 hypothetical protein SAMN05660971_04345 [Halomonas cupida]